MPKMPTNDAHDAAYRGKSPKQKLTLQKRANAVSPMAKPPRPTAQRNMVSIQDMAKTLNTRLLALILTHLKMSNKLREADDVVDDVDEEEELPIDELLPENSAIHEVVDWLVSGCGCQTPVVMAVNGKVTKEDVHDAFDETLGELEDTVRDACQAVEDLNDLFAGFNSVARKWRGDAKLKDVLAKPRRVSRVPPMWSDHEIVDLKQLREDTA